MEARLLDLQKLKVFPLDTRRSLTTVEEILIDPESAPRAVHSDIQESVRETAAAMRQARTHHATNMLIYGAHLLRNGAAPILERMMAQGWITHLATNGAATIHDWEYAWLGRSTESVREGVAAGNFGTWEETGRNIHLALLSGGLSAEGYGRALGRFIEEDGVNIPQTAALQQQIRESPGHSLTPARADLLVAMERHGLEAGRHSITHRWKHASILAQAFRLGVPVTVHPGIGYDIIANHPMFNGAVIGRAAELDFRAFGGSVEGLDGGVVLSIGSAIMGPQVFEKSLSCVNNLRLQQGKPVVAGHRICVVDLQDGGRWDWSQGEPPKTNPAYYLRFCKSFARMGGTLDYVQADNALFIHHLYKELQRAT
jgi:hypothetical protein